MLADLLLPVVRHHLAVLFVVVPRREIEMIEMHANAVFFRSGLQHAQTFRHHFLADTIAGNDRDPVLLLWVGHREGPLSCGTGKTMPCPDCNGPKFVAAQRCSARLTGLTAAA